MPVNLYRTVKLVAAEAPDCADHLSWIALLDVGFGVSGRHHLQCGALTWEGTVSCDEPDVATVNTAEATPEPAAF